MLPEGKPLAVSKGNGDCNIPTQALGTHRELGTASSDFSVLDFEDVGHGLVAGFHATYAAQELLAYSAWGCYGLKTQELCLPPKKAQSSVSFVRVWSGTPD